MAEGLSKRVSALEGDVRALGENVRDMRIDVSNLSSTLARGFEELQRQRDADRQALSAQFDRFQQTRLEDFRAAKTPWTAMASAAGAIVTVLALIGGMAILPIQSAIISLNDKVENGAQQRFEMARRVSFVEALTSERATTLTQINDRLRAVEGGRWTAEQQRLYEANINVRLNELQRLLNERK